MRDVQPLHPVGDATPLGRFDMHDLDSLRLVLRGSSVIDWSHLDLNKPELVHAFMRVNEFDLGRKADRARIEVIRTRALDYLKEHLGYRVASPLAAETDLVHIFEMAGDARRLRIRRQACALLKVMHIVHYVEARELRSSLPISNTELAVFLRAKIEKAVRGFTERSFPIIRFEGNTKRYHSLLSKLLAKKETQATRVLDSLRFRLVVERLEDIPPVLLAITRELTPFNYVLPDSVDNTLLDLDSQLSRAGNLIAMRAMENARGIVLNEHPIQIEDPTSNEFSGPGYRVVNLVAEIPIRVDRVIELKNPAHRLGSTVFYACEFQLVDRATAENNERGENRHSLYKKRQEKRVYARLEARKEMR